MSFQMSERQSDALAVLIPAGFAITHFYGDGIIRVVNRSDREQSAFIRPDGSVKKQVIPAFDNNGAFVA